MWGADWRIYATAKGTFFYYKPDSIIRSQKNIVKVWTKEEYSEEQIIEERRKIPDISFLLQYQEIHCVERKTRPLSFIAYSEDGVVLNTSKIPKGREEEYWAFVVPDSVGDNLLKLLCK